MNSKKIFNVLLFLAVMGLTFYAVFHGNNLSQIWMSMKKMSLAYLLPAILLGLFFISAEGCMIWYLLRSVGGRSGLLRCIGYSFVGFFYSGITPSATGGQPVQLYYMKKDGNSLAGSSVVLMTVALLYKFVLVLIGTGILLFWRQPLQNYLQGYFWLYNLGLFLNVILVLVLAGVMTAPELMKKIITGPEKLLVRMRILKKSPSRAEKMNGFIDSYQSAVQFLLVHKGKICVVILMTFLQRCSAFFLTYVVYRGFGLEGSNLLTVMLLQASVYIAVDMLPVPGAQGITEMMYQSVFLGTFTREFLMPSLCLTRGISFYLMLLVSLGVVLVRHSRSRC